MDVSMRVLVVCSLAMLAPSLLGCAPTRYTDNEQVGWCRQTFTAPSKAGAQLDPDYLAKARRREVIGIRSPNGEDIAFFAVADGNCAVPLVPWSDVENTYLDVRSIARPASLETEECTAYSEGLDKLIESVPDYRGKDPSEIGAELLYILAAYGVWDVSVGSNTSQGPDLSVPGVTNYTVSTLQDCSYALIVLDSALSQISTGK